MSDTTDTQGIRFSQILAGAMAAVTAAVLGSTMGFAGTVVGAGLASIVTTLGGALYLRSIQRTKQGVRTVRDKVVARAGATSVTLVQEDLDADDLEDPEGPAADEDDQPPARRKMRWPAVIAGAVLAFVLGMMAVTGVEWLRGEPLSGGEGTTVGGIVRSGQSGGQDHDKAPPATRESTTPNTGQSTVTVTENPPTSGNAKPQDPPGASDQPTTTTPDTTTTGHDSASAPPPTSGEAG
jgi:hypothetical protein